MNTSKKCFEYLNEYNLARNSIMKPFLSSKFINSSISTLFVIINKLGLYLSKSLSKYTK